MPPLPGADRTGLPAPGVLRITHSGVIRSWRSRERRLRELGVDLTVVTARRWNEAGVTLHAVADPGEQLETARTIGDHPCFFLFDPVPLWRALRRRSYDVIDMHEEPYGLPALEITLLRWILARRTKMVFYSAQNLSKRYPLPIRLIERFVYRSSAGAYVCNLEAGEVLRRKGFRGIVRHIPLGVDPPAPPGAGDGYPASPDAGSPGEGSPGAGSPGAGSPGAGSPGAGSAGAGSADGGPSFRVGYAGRIEIRKGLLVLLSALVPEDSWELTVVGDGPDLERVRRYAAEIGVQDRVRFLGFVGPEEMPAVYRRFDVLAVPSIPTAGWIEQFCRVAVEAMTEGVPVVASDTGALPEVVGEGGVLVPPGDAGALHGSLRSLAEDHETRSKLGESGRRHARRFLWANVAAEQISLYRDVLVR